MDYKRHFGLKEAPFRLSPDPDFFFPSDTHVNALETLVYAIRSGEGFIQITGHPGTGKSMLLRKILKDIGASVVVGLVLHANIPARELLAVLMQDLGIDISHIQNSSRQNLILLFRAFLTDKAKAGKQVIIIVDEAQNLPEETLEELRMLSNLETRKAKLLQIILVGQLELEDKISQERLSQLAQRITIRYRLKPLTLIETRAYIWHRLEVATINREAISVSFKADTIKKIHQFSRGIPRLINVVCERSLMAAYIEASPRVTKSHFKKAVLSIQGETRVEKKGSDRRPLALAFLAVLILLPCLWAGLKYPAPTFGKDLASRVAAVISSFPSATAPVTSPPTGPGGTIVKKEIAQGKDSDQTKDSAQALSIKNWVAGDRYQLGLINLDDQSFTLMRKNDKTLAKAGSIPLQWPYPRGVYMAGFKENGIPFIFNPELYYQEKIGINNPEFWSLIRKSGHKGVTPVIAVGSSGVAGSTPNAGAGEILKTVRSWADAWQAMDLEKIMSYTGNNTSVYDLETRQPEIFSKGRMRQIKQAVFKSSGFIQVSIEDPLCLVSPLNPDVGVAVFHQTYKSRSYRDTGTKFLYFRRASKDPGGPDWKITGKLWILDPES